MRPVAAALMLAAALSMAACGPKSSPQPAKSSTEAARPSSPATVTIASPKNGQTLPGPDIPLKVMLVGATIVPTTNAHIVNMQGHLHVYLDDQIVSMTFGQDQTLPNVSPGQHVLKVEFVASDHRPFDPRVITQIVFEVKG